MTKRWLWLAALAWSAAGLVACGDDTLVAVPKDGGLDGSLVPDASTSDSATAADSGTASDAEADGEAAAPPPSRLLLSYNGSSQSELVAFGLQSRAVDGRMLYPGFIGTTYVTPGGPWLLEQASDVVARLDPAQPWMVRSSWNVALNDLTDAGFTSSYSDPDAVVVGAGSKAYVLRYTRNLVAVLDTTQAADAGVPVSTIDLGGQVQDAGDGYVEMADGFYDAATRRVYVLLGNINRFDVGCAGYCQLCSSTSPSVVAIDTTTDSLVDLNGAAPGVGLALGGYGPTAMVHDAAGGRLLVLEAGCNLPVDGGAGPMVKREVESLDLTTGQAQELLDLTAQTAFPGGLVYIDGHHAIVVLDTAYAWDPTTAALGPAIANAPDAFAYDGAGNLLGVKARYGADGGMQGYDVESVSMADGGVTRLGTDPFSLASGFLSGVSLWPPAH